MNTDSTKVFYDTRHVPFTERESFNNTVLLLTMVKKEHYYIVGFSRIDGVIEIAFDFAGDLHGDITEFVSIDFCCDEDHVVFKCNIRNIDRVIEQNMVSHSGYGMFKNENGTVVYTRKVKKDKVFPLGTEQMNELIFSVKNDVVVFLENYYNN